MSREYVSTQFNCRRISDIVHRSFIHKQAVDSLVLLISGLNLIPTKKEKVSGKLPPRLSEKVHAPISKRIVGGFEFTVLQRNLKEWHDSYSVTDSVLIISHIIFRDCREYIFSHKISRNSCIHSLYAPYNFILD